MRLVRRSWKKKGMLLEGWDNGQTKFLRWSLYDSKNVLKKKPITNKFDHKKAAPVRKVSVEPLAARE